MSLKKKRLSFIVAALVVASILWWAMPRSHQKHENSRSLESLSRVAAELNRAVPVMIDKETELLSAAGSEAMLIYNYRLVRYSVSQLDAKQFATRIKPGVTRNACNRAETREEFLNKGITLSYAYFDKDKQHIATIDVTSADCGFTESAESP
jgi:hypothetical protein